MREIRWSNLILVLPVLWIIGCRSGSELVSDTSTVSESKVNYTAVYIIHGDGEYLYHDKNGHPQQADLNALLKAEDMAKQAENGKVFIFHQRAKQRFLGIFSKKSSTFFYYRNGKLKHQESYLPSDGEDIFKAEKKLFSSFHHQASKPLIFLYFGHEIPSEEGKGYHRSRKDVPFNGRYFSESLTGFQPDESRIDLTVLSTCNNGTPAMVKQLQPVTRYLLASPQDLHLSHMDPEALLDLDRNPDIPAGELANRIAKQTFDRLSKYMQTAVTLTIFELEEMEAINPIVEKYRQFADQNKVLAGRDNRDCSYMPFWDETATQPYKVFYRPPKFGRDSNQTKFSGWGCPPFQTLLVDE